VPEKSIALIGVLEYGEFPEMLRGADVVRRALGCEVVVFFTKRVYTRLVEDTQAVIDHGHRWMDWRGEIHDAPAAPSHSVRGMESTEVSEGEEPVLFSRKPSRRGVLAVLIAAAAPWTMLQKAGAGAVSGAKAAVADIVNLVADYRRFRARAQIMSDVLQHTAPKLVIVGQDPVGSDLAFLLHRARKHHIPTLILPFAMFNLKEIAEYAAQRSDHHARGALAHIVATLVPQWSVAYRGLRLLRLSAPRAAALELAGLVDGPPWLPCGSSGSVIACDSAVARDEFIRMGVDGEQPMVVGAPVHDRLFAILSEGAEGRQRFLQAWQMREGRPLLVCGWPANIFPWLGGRPIAFPDYAAVARLWAEILAQMCAQHDINVLVSAHPKTSDDELEAARMAGLAVVRGETERMIAHCDLFTTLNGSSITAWAIACGKPVVLFDCFETGYREFLGLPGVEMTYSADAFREELALLCRDEPARRRLALAQQKVAPAWGVLDGKAEQRLGALMRALASADAAVNHRAAA